MPSHSLPKPLRIVKWLCLVAGGVGLLALLATPLDLEIYSLGTKMVGGHEFARVAGIPYGLAALTFFWAGIALLNDLVWSRLSLLLALLTYLATMAWVGIATNDLNALMSSALFGPIATLLLARYLYRGKGPRAYYEQLKRAEGT